MREVPGPPGPPLVLLHGWTLGTDLNWFSGGFDAAAGHGRVIGVDLRGHGRGLRSDAPFSLEATADDVADLVGRLGRGPAILVGYSMGGSVALLCAHRHPEAVAGLVLAATGLRWAASARERLVWRVLAAVEWGLRLPTPKALAHRYLARTVRRSPELRPYCGWVSAEMRRGDPAAIGAAGRSLARFDARDLAGGLNVPASVVVTMRDRLVRPERQLEMAEAIPGAGVVNADVAHNGWLAAPSAFATAIGEAIGDVVARARLGSAIGGIE